MYFISYTLVDEASCLAAVSVGTLSLRWGFSGAPEEHTEGGNKAYREWAKEGPKEGRVMRDLVCSNYVTDTAVRVPVCLCVLSILQSQSGTAVWEGIVLVSSDLANAAERLIST